MCLREGPFSFQIVVCVVVGFCGFCVWCVREGVRVCVYTHIYVYIYVCVCEQTYTHVCLLCVRKHWWSAVVSLLWSCAVMRVGIIHTRVVFSGDCVPQSPRLHTSFCLDDTPPSQREWNSIPFGIWMLSFLRNGMKDFIRSSVYRIAAKGTPTFLETLHSSHDDDDDVNSPLFVNPPTPCRSLRPATHSSIVESTFACLWSPPPARFFSRNSGHCPLFIPTALSFLHRFSSRRWVSYDPAGLSC